MLTVVLPLSPPRPEMEPISDHDGGYGSSSGGNNAGVYWNRERIGPDTDKLRVSGGTGYSDSTGIEPHPMGYAAMIVLDGELLETIELREVAP